MPGTLGCRLVSVVQGERGHGRARAPDGRGLGARVIPGEAFREMVSVAIARDVCSSLTTATFRRGESAGAFFLLAQ